MKKWGVTLIVDASIHIEVEAENAEEAKDKALSTAGSPGLCYQCSRELDVGDVIDAVEAVEIGAAQEG